MPFTTNCSTDFHQESFRIRHEDNKLFNKLVSKESSKSYPSFRVYYGDVSGAVPFVWEICPGTPKHSLSDKSNKHSLTPPPSFYTNSSDKKYSKNSNHSRSKLLLFYTLLRRMNPARKRHSSSSPKSSVSSLSWSTSSLSWDSSLFYGRDHDIYGMDSSSKSCFTPGVSPVLIVKKALLSIIGRGSHA